ALLVDDDGVVGNEIVACIHNAVMRIKAVSVFVYVVAKHIQTAADRDRNIRTFCKELVQELKQLPATVLILLGYVAVLSFYREVVIDQVGCFQHEMIIQCDRDNKNFGGLLAWFLAQIEVALRLHGGAEQSQFELFFSNP